MTCLHDALNCVCNEIRPRFRYGRTRSLVWAAFRYVAVRVSECPDVKTTLSVIWRQLRVSFNPVFGYRCLLSAVSEPRRLLDCIYTYEMNLALFSYIRDVKKFFTFFYKSLKNMFFYVFFLQFFWCFLLFNVVFLLLLKHKRTKLCGLWRC